jgi:hypothetical protein
MNQENAMKHIKRDNTEHYGRRNRSVIRERIANREYATVMRGAW